MIHARAFTLVALCTALCIWCYWRIVLNPRPTSMGVPAGLLLGSIGLLYSHYFTALFLPALGLFHLLFAPKNRRWWRPVFLLVLAALLAMLQLPGFLRGLDRTVVDGDLHNRALSATTLISRFVRLLTNSLVDPSPPFSELLLLALPLALIIVFLQRLRRGKGFNTVWLLVFTSAALLALVIVINEVFRVIVDNRIRYLMPLWPLSALLAGAGLWRLAGRHRRVCVTVLLAVWLALGAWLNLVTGLSLLESRLHLRRSDVHTTYREVGKYVSSADGLILDHEAGYLDWQHLYVQMLDVPYVLYIRHRDDPLKHVLRLHKAHSLPMAAFPDAGHCAHGSDGRCAGTGSLRASP